MKFRNLIYTLTLIIYTKVKADEVCWSELLSNPFPCCKNDDVKEIGKDMDGAWGEENGTKCGIRNKRYNWNFRDKFDETRNQWEDFKVKWENEYESNFERLSILPGEDETMLNFGWQSLLNDDKPKIRISSNSNMSDYKEFVGTNDNYRYVNKDIYYQNKVTVTGIERNSVYYYQRYINKIWENPVEFKTNDPDNFNFIFVGDPQIGGSNDRIIYDSRESQGYSLAIKNDAFNWNMTIYSSFEMTKNPSLLLSAGDNADTENYYSSIDYYNQESEYSAFLLPELIKTIPIAPALGNHETKTEGYKYHFNPPNTYSTKRFEQMSLVPAYSYFFKYNNVLVVVLESNKSSCIDCEIIFSKAVKKYPDTDWRIALFHHDVYGNGKTHSQGDALRLRPCLTGLFSIYKFDVVINGHDHVYTTTKFIAFNNGNEKKNYIVKDIKKGEVNKNPKGTFFITANCSTGSKFFSFDKGTFDYVYNYNQTYTSTFGVMDFKKANGKVRLTIDIYEVDTKKKIDESYIFEKSALETIEKPKFGEGEKSWSNELGYPSCQSTKEIKFYAEQGGFGYENGSWCGLENDLSKCWAFELGYTCCKKTKTVQKIDENKRKWGYEYSGLCGFSGDDDDSLTILTENCWSLDQGYPCCEGQYQKYDDDWGYQNNEWCGIIEQAPTTTTTRTTTTQKSISSTNTPSECWAKALGYECCKSENPKVYTVDGDGEWAIENSEWCGIIKKCWSLDLGYPCCNPKNTNVVYTDGTGKWGVENGDWCGIINNIITTTTTKPTTTRSTTRPTTTRATTTRTTTTRATTTRTTTTRITTTRITTTRITTTRTTTTTTQKPKPTSCANNWAQCGGIDFNGPTTCCDPSAVCKYLNDYYYQCVLTY